MTEDKFHTCRHCGIKDGEDTSNWVILNECRKCRQRREDESDYEEAKESGKVMRNGSIMCPYCGYVQTDDVYEWDRHTEWVCPACDKKSDLAVDYTVHFTTSRREEKNE